MPIISDHTVLYFVQFVNEIRPEKKEDSSAAVKHLQHKIALLRQNKDMHSIFRHHCMEILLESDIQPLFSDNHGIYSSDNFFQQFFKDLKHKLLPPLANKASITYKLNLIFRKKTDYRWVTAIPNTLWTELFELTGIDNDFIETHFSRSFRTAFTTLSYRIAAMGLDEEFSDRFLENGELISPFIEQNKEASVYINSVPEENSIEEKVPYSLQHTAVMLNQCLESIENIRKNSRKFGTSLKQTYLLNSIENKIHRLRILIDILDKEVFNYDRLLNYLKEIIYEENHRNNLSYLFSRNIRHLAYQIAEHKGNAGEHYISTNYKEYLSFFRAGLGGGAIIAILVVLKTEISKLPLTDFWMSVVYSLNYGIGFLLIHFSGFTVATKQPAMTASALASSLDNKKNQSTSLQAVALLMAKVSRSQLASVTGNLLAVFPVALAITYLLQLLTPHTLMDDAHAVKYLESNSPLYSLCWFYGGIAGMYLFLTGIVAGYFDNAVVYSKIPERVVEHPGLQSIFSRQRLQKIAHYTEHNLGAVMSNMAIGVFLGTAAFIGHTFGIPYDIRHVTFSMGTIAIAFHSLHFELTLQTFIWAFVGIASIGFFNIFVSFGLAFYVALKSRNIALAELKQLPKLLLVYFTKYPKDFFFPPKEDRLEEDVFGATDAA
jgi:site-specific recombinase